MILFSDKECTLPCSNITATFLTDSTEEQVYVMYIGFNTRRWFIHNNGSDIILRYGDKVFNYGKSVEKVQELEIVVSLGNDINELIADGFTVEWLPDGDVHPLTMAAFNTNKKLLRFS